MFDTYIGTADGVHHLRDGGPGALGLAGREITALHADPAALLAGSYGDGLFRSTDRGHSWDRVEAGLTATVFRVVAPDPSRPGALLAGTEPARLFRSEDAGASWAEVEGVRVPGHEDWSLPYSPRAGALRNVYGPPGRPGHLLASVEVGGLLQSHDGGVTCTVAPVIHDEDIHLVTGHPEDPDVLYTALGTATITPLSAEDEAGLGGVARSRDGGRTWEKVAAGYTRAVLVPPARPDLVVAGPAPRVGRDGRILVSADGGDTWEEAAGGIDVPMPDMVQLFVPAPDGSVWAVCSGGRLLRAEPGAWTWSEMAPGLEVKSVAFGPPSD
jgi:photosystem II stability/assembly factor-like uncharacterized protein